jgi:hypothetical protein
MISTSGNRGCDFAHCSLLRRPNCSQVKTLRATSMLMSFPETIYDLLFRNYSVVQTRNFFSCPVGWSQMVTQVKKPDVEVLGWRGYTWSNRMWRVLGWRGYTWSNRMWRSWAGVVTPGLTGCGGPGLAWLHLV